MASVTDKYDWILAIVAIAFCFSAAGNGANDVANSYATSIAAQTLTLAQAGILACFTEFIGAVALGDRVTDTIKNGIIDIDRFEGRPGVLMLAMCCAEVASATWLCVATSLGFPVSTTQTIVGALIGVGIAARSQISWDWDDGSVSQVAASWAIAPLIAACFAAIVFATVKFAVLERKEPFKWAMRLIPFYLAFTSAILALFIVIEAPTAPSLEEFGAGKGAGIILAVFFGMLLISYVFFVPYFKRRLIHNDTRVKWYHIPLGPTLLRDDPWIYFPAKSSNAVIDYSMTQKHQQSSPDSSVVGISDEKQPQPDDEKAPGDVSTTEKVYVRPAGVYAKEPRERWLEPVRGLPVYHPKRIWNSFKYITLQGITRDCVSYHSAALEKTHERARLYDNRAEHLWTYAQVASAMIMSIAHGSNDVANAVGPFAATYATFRSGAVDTESDTPVWMLVVAGLLLGFGFLVFGYHIVRALGNRITKMSPTRGFATELGAAITVLLASRTSLPVSTTQCLTGAAVGVALMNFDVRAVNWRQVAFIFSGWILTLPCAALISGVLCVIGLNTPHF